MKKLFNYIFLFCAISTRCLIFKADRIFSPSAIYHPALLEHQYLGEAEESEGVEPKTGSMCCPEPYRGISYVGDVIVHCL